MRQADHCIKGELHGEHTTIPEFSNARRLYEPSGRSASQDFGTSAAIDYSRSQGAPGPMTRSFEDIVKGTLFTIVVMLTSIISLSGSYYTYFMNKFSQGSPGGYFVNIFNWVRTGIIVSRTGLYMYFDIIHRQLPSRAYRYIGPPTSSLTLPGLCSCTCSYLYNLSISTCPFSSCLSSTSCASTLRISWASTTICLEIHFVIFRLRKTLQRPASLFLDFTMGLLL